MYVNGGVDKPHYTIGKSTLNTIDFHYSISREVEAKPLPVNNTRWREENYESKPRTEKKNMHIRWQYNITTDDVIAVSPKPQDIENGLIPSDKEVEQNKNGALAFIRAFHRAQS
ncbi:MAG: hypothetical protein J0H12_02500 [Candidatus Paracaedimonas acanthamoebae]|uniref:Uncharacterized protein n=1 Tax=Candidatus Paracaedimonas acanthamoebae TaxID=244581 RepID=A0A8J7TV91_9PROT|nr:hypothetical protein [Candidatus Paracaedimonas acanthamoebae]